MNRKNYQSFLNSFIQSFLYNPSFTPICKCSLELHVEKLCSNVLFMSMAKYLNSTLAILDLVETSSTRLKWILQKIWYALKIICSLSKTLIPGKKNVNSFSRLFFFLILRLLLLMINDRFQRWKLQKSSLDKNETIPW